MPGGWALEKEKYDLVKTKSGDRGGSINLSLRPESGGVIGSRGETKKRRGVTGKQETFSQARKKSNSTVRVPNRVTFKDSKKVERNDLWTLGAVNRSPNDVPIRPSHRKLGK